MAELPKQIEVSLLATTVGRGFTVIKLAIKIESCPFMLFITKATSKLPAFG